MREQQLQQLIEQRQQSISAEGREDIETVTLRWRTVVDEKNREIDRFRAELDAILEVLRQLQTEGIVIPYSGRLTTDNYLHPDDRTNDRT